MTNTQPRAQAGVGTVVVLLTMVMVASIAAGVLINTTGVLPGQSGGSGSAPAAAGTDGLVVVGQTGTVVDGTVGVVNLTVVPGPNADAVDLGGTTVTWVAPEGAYNLVSDGATGATGDGTFHASASSAAGESLPVLDSRDDRAVLTFDLGSPAAPVGETFGRELGPGDQVSVTLTTDSGTNTRIRLAAPESLGSKRVVVL